MSVVAQSFVQPAPTVPEESRWVKCPRDGAFIYHKRLNRNLKVCQNCNYHFRISARERIAFLVDADSFTPLNDDIQASDPLGFVDIKPYPTRIQEAQQKTGQKEAVIYGAAKIEDAPWWLQPSSSVSLAARWGLRSASYHSCGGIGWPATPPAAYHYGLRGTRMQEGCISLMQMAKTSAALAVLAEQRIPVFVLLADPTYGGVTASFATLGDVLLAEPDAMIGLPAGRLSSTIKQKLPDSFQRADFLLEHGMIDLIVPRGELRAVARLLSAYSHAFRGPATNDCPAARRH